MIQHQQKQRPNLSPLLQALPPAPCQRSMPSEMGHFSSMPAEYWVIPEERVPSPGHFVLGNLWNLSLRENDVDAYGPLGFLRHATTMASPTVPRYVSTGKFPVKSLSDLRQWSSVISE